MHPILYTAIVIARMIMAIASKPVKALEFTDKYGVQRIQDARASDITRYYTARIGGFDFLLINLLVVVLSWPHYPRIRGHSYQHNAPSRDTTSMKQVHQWTELGSIHELSLEQFRKLCSSNGMISFCGLK
jgi:hypothetical protein